jgi:hypothetical protein
MQLDNVGKSFYDIYKSETSKIHGIPVMTAAAPTAPQRQRTGISINTLAGCC